LTSSKIKITENHPPSFPGFPLETDRLFKNSYRLIWSRFLTLSPKRCLPKQLFCLHWKPDLNLSCTIIWTTPMICRSTHY